MRQVILGLVIGAVVGGFFGYSYGASHPFLVKVNNGIEKIEGGIDSFNTFRQELKDLGDSVLKKLEKLEHPFREDKNNNDGTLSPAAVPIEPTK